jgi:hypothetical protein
VQQLSSVGHQKHAAERRQQDRELGAAQKEAARVFLCPVDLD